MEIGIKFGADPFPAKHGEFCICCIEPITGTAYHTFIQVVNPEQVKYTGHKYCEACYLREFGEESE